MLSMQKFKGINNVLQPHELSDSELTTASNVDVDLAGRIRRRGGHTLTSATQHTNVWEGGGVALATRGAAGDLVELGSGTVVRAAVGHARVWYCQFPDGSVAWSNGTDKGIYAAASGRAWGVPVPATLGAASDTAGDLFGGDYQYALTHARLSDGQEGGPAYYMGKVTVASGGITFTDLPMLAGYRTNVYLTSHFGGERYLAGYAAADGTFAFTGKNKDLALPCLTDWMNPPPAGILPAFWRGRALLAVGNALFASQLHSWELFDLRRDFKQFSAPITLVQPVNSGIWVGTQKELCFLAGDAWDKLARRVKVTGGVVLGSGVAVPGEHLRHPNGQSVDGDCMACIADGWLFAGTDAGELIPLSVERYRTAATEVCATFRVQDGTPQYIAIPQ